MTLLQQFIAGAYGQSKIVAAFDAENIQATSTTLTDLPKSVDSICARAINSSIHNFKINEKIKLAEPDQDWSIVASVWNDQFQTKPGQTWLAQDVKLGAYDNQLPGALNGLSAGVCLTFDGSRYELAVTSSDGYASSHHGYFFTEKFSMRDGHNQLVVVRRAQHNASNYQFFLNGQSLSVVDLKQTIVTERKLPTYGIYCASDENGKVRNAGLKTTMYFDEDTREFGSFGAGWGGGVRIYDLVLCSVAFDEQDLIEQAFAEADRKYGLSAQSILPFVITHRHNAGGRSIRTPEGRLVRLWLESAEPFTKFELIEEQPRGIKLIPITDINYSEYDVFLPNSSDSSVSFIIRTTDRPTYGFQLTYDLRLDRFTNFRRF